MVFLAISMAFSFPVPLAPCPDGNMPRPRRFPEIHRPKSKGPRRFRQGPSLDGSTPPDLPVLLRDDPARDRQLHRAKAQGLARDLFADAVDLEHDPAGLDAGGPEIDRALARTHPHFDRLGRDRHIRENADPDPALTLHVAGDRAAGRFDLPRGDALGLGRLQGEGAEVEKETALGFAMDAALVHLAILGALRLQHCPLLL